MSNLCYRISLPTLTLLITIASVASAATVRPIDGPVILSKPGPTSEYLWDATSYVAGLVTDRVLGDDGLRAVEATAVAALIEKAPASSAKTLKLSVVYKLPSASSIYGTPTFSSAQPLCDVTLPKADAVKSGATWAQNVADGKTPEEVKVLATGKLPPAQ